MAKKVVKDLLQVLRDTEKEETKGLESRAETEQFRTAINRRMRIVTREHRRKSILSEAAAAKILLSD